MRRFVELPQASVFILLAFVWLALPISQAVADGEGQADLDKATELKIAAEGLRDLNKVVELLDEALEKGLDDENTEFAESMLVATLMQRATSLSSAVLGKPITDPRRDPRWLQVRQFALTDLQRVIEIDREMTEAHLLIGRLQSLPLGDPNAARRSLTKVIKADGVEPEQLAQAYALRGATQQDIDKQAADYGKAIELEPEKPEYYLLRARALVKRQEFEASLADLTKAIELEPTKVEYLLIRSRAYQQQEKYDEALADVDKAAEFAPENAAVFEQKGVVLQSQGKSEEAIAAFDRATELAPTKVAPYQFRGELYRQRGDVELAIAEMSKAIERAPNEPASRLIRAELYSRQERFEDALTDVEAVLARQPGLLQAHLMRTALLARLDRTAEATGSLERLAEAAPDQPAIHLQLAGLYMDAGESSKAIDSLTRVIDLASDNQPALRMRGDMYLSVGKHEEALADFDKSFELDPDDTGLLNNYAWTLATSPFDSLRNGERAIELATKAAELTEYREAHILSTLAAAYAESGDFEKAIEWSEKAVATHADDEEKTRDMSVELAAELESYKRSEPWRELQQDGDLASGAEIHSQSDEAQAPVPPPVRTLDF